MSRRRTARLPRSLLALSLLGLAAAPGCRDESAPGPSDSESLGQRVFQPPASVVRAVPPHRIGADGIGPYKLGAELKDILNTLPHGPRVELLQIERLVGYRLVRVEQDDILVGIGPGARVAFVAALDAEIAKTENGFGVGSEIDTLREALGPERPVFGARDARLVELARVPGARLVVDDGKVIAIVVLAGGAPAAERDIADALSGGASTGHTPVRAGRPAPRSNATSEPDPADGGCSAATATEALAGQPVIDVARAEAASSPRVHYGCYTGTAAEAVVESGDDLILIMGEPDKLRRAAALPLPGLVFAGAVDVDRDGRHEIVAVTEKRTSEEIAIGVEVLRAENGRLVRAAGEEVYRLTSGAAASVGAKQLKDVDLLIEADPGDEELQIAGFYLHRAGGKVHTVSPLQPRSVVLDLRKRGSTAGTSGGSGRGGDQRR
jgi:hypothetical protein